MTLTLTREELVDEIRDALSDACDMDVTFGQYAEAVARMLDKHGIVYWCDPHPHVPCSHCGKPWNFSGPCQWGGCPLGADL